MWRKMAMGARKHQEDGMADEERDGLLDEYRSLRSEIHNIQAQRLQIISLTVGAFGVILSISGSTVLGSGTVTPERRLLVAVGGAIALYSIVIPSLIMMLSAQQAVQRLGDYIRIFIEPRVPGLNWQNRWHEFKLRHQYRGGLRGTGAIYYFLSILPLLLPVYALSQHTQNWLLILILVPFTVWSIYLSYDLQAAISKGWKWAHWADSEKSDSREPPTAGRDERSCRGKGL
jgi:hypothetical protein